MAKNYTTDKSFESTPITPSSLVISRILAFSKAYKKQVKNDSALDLLRN